MTNEQLLRGEKLKRAIDNTRKDLEDAESVRAPLQEGNKRTYLWHPHVGYLYLSDEVIAVVATLTVEEHRKKLQALEEEFAAL
jgi:hypothetical protein